MLLAEIKSAFSALLFFLTANESDDGRQDRYDCDNIKDRLKALKKLDCCG